MAKVYVQGINHRTLKACREQIGMPLERVERFVPKIREVEEGVWGLTFRQLDILADLYQVPRWVFLEDEIPEAFDYNKTIPGFRTIKEHPTVEDPFTKSKVSTIMARLDALRSFIIELDADLGQPIAPFVPPAIDKDPSVTATNIRSWLGVAKDEYPTFETWRLLLENKGILVFLTSKYKGWSHVDRTLFRGMSMHYDVLPIIVINDSDAHNAQVFTLFHELGHLLREESHADTWEIGTPEEHWCDMLAGETLMPSDAHFIPATTARDLQRGAARFNVSRYAYLVRLRQLHMIDRPLYFALEQELIKEWRRVQDQFKQHVGGPPRTIPQEKLKQYGRVTHTLLQAYSENELNLVQTMRILDIKSPKHVAELMEL